MNATCVTVNLLGAAAGKVVFLAQMLGEHPLAEARFVPRDVFALHPGGRRVRAVHYVRQRQHGTHIVSPVAAKLPSLAGNQPMELRQGNHAVISVDEFYLHRHAGPSARRETLL